MQISDNPGSFRPYKLKKLSSHLISLFEMLKKENYEQGFRYLITESINYINRNSIKDLSGINSCPICKNRNNNFIHLSNQFHFAFNSICHWCSSRSRHRGLYFLYKSKFENNKNKIKILHFAPEVVFMKLFENNSLITYHTADLYLKGVVYENLDIQKVDLPNCTYDYILCNHVLEHVKDDKIAIEEIERILKPDGQALITVPGDFRKKNTRSYKHELPNGHYRDYGFDFVNLLKEYFKEVTTFDLSNFDSKGCYGIRKNELVFIAKKVK